MQAATYLLIVALHFGHGGITDHLVFTSLEDCKAAAQVYLQLKSQASSESVVTCQRLKGSVQ